MKHHVNARTLVFGLAIVAAIVGATGAPLRAETLEQIRNGTHYHGIAFNRAGSADLLLATHHGLFAVSADGNATRVSPVQDFMGFSPDPADALGYYASGHPEAGGNSGFLRSRDGGANWKMISEGLGGPVDFHLMDVSPADPATIYGAYGPLQVSTDGGANWALAGDLPPSTIKIAASAISAERLYAATEAGLFASENGGGSWAAIAFDGEVVSTVETGADGALYAFVPGQGLLKGNEIEPGAWQVLSNGFGDAIPLHLAVNSTVAARLALTTHDNGVFESIDGGMSWNLYAKPAP